MFLEKIFETKFNNDSIRKFEPVKANGLILAINKFFLDSLAVIKNPKKLISPFSLFTSKKEAISTFNFSVAQPSALNEKISEIGQPQTIVSPLQDFMRSLSASTALKPSTSSRFSAEIISIVKENQEFKTIRVKRPSDWEFLPGQYLEIKAENSSASKPSILAIASGVFDDYIEITAKPNPKPTHPNSFLNCDVGDYLTISGPLGTHFPVDLVTSDTPVLLLGGGSGLTALKSLMASLPFGIDSKLIYSSKTKDELLYSEEIEKWKALGHIISLTRDNDANFEHGRITEHLSKIEIKPNTLIFICGPKELVLETTKFLASIGVPRDQIYGSLPITAKEGGPVLRGDDPKMMLA